MEAGRKRANETRMKGCLNVDNKLTEIYMPRKCDYSDKIITSKDHSSAQFSICDVLPLLSRSTPTEPSTSPRATSLPSQASLEPADRATPLSRRSSRKRDSSD